MRVLVCGDRNWVDYDLVVEKLLSIGDGPHIIIDGAARGADSCGNRAAINLGWPYVRFPANWNKYNRAAGPIRNQQMLDEGKPDLVLAFHDDINGSLGTADMVRRARRAGVKVEVISHENHHI